MQCLICKSQKNRILFIGRDLLHNSEGVFSISQCENCKLAWLNEPISDKDLEKFYPEDYISFPKSISKEGNLFKKLDRQFGVNKRVNRILRRHHNNGKILDVGCATGVFLAEFQKRGWECYGIEPSERAANYARDTYNINVINSPIKENLFPDSFFDVITMWDVLEHVPDPINTVNIIKKMLKPGGLFVISMPNTNSWERYIFKKYWAGWDIPRHTFIFNDRNIRALLTSANFSIENINSFTGRHGVFVLSLGFWLNSRERPTWAKNTMIALARSIVARLFTYPFYMIADRLNRSSIMAVFARKSL